jgi:hypothetical protein
MVAATAASHPNGSSRAANGDSTSPAVSAAAAVMPTFPLLAIPVHGADDAGEIPLLVLERVAGPIEPADALAHQIPAGGEDRR